MREKMMDMKKYVKIAGKVISVLSIIFILYAIFRTDFKLSEVTDWGMFLTVCSAGIILKTFTVYLSGSAWCRQLEYFSKKKCSLREALRVYAKSNIGKYLPGNVMHYVERNLFAEKLELTQKQIAAASVFEVVCLVTAAFFMGVCMSYARMCEVLEAVVDRQPVLRLVPLAGLFCAVLIFAFLYVRYRKRMIDSGGRFKKLRLDRQKAIRLFKTYAVCLAIYSAVLVILGIILVFVYWYWAGRPDLLMAGRIISAYMIAWVLGFVIPGAPGGIGVREMALTLLLSPVIGKDLVVTLGILHRLITVIGDFAAYLLRGVI